MTFEYFYGVCFDLLQDVLQWGVDFIIWGFTPADFFGELNIAPIPFLLTTGILLTLVARITIHFIK